MNLLKNSLNKVDRSIWILLALSIFAWGPLLNPAYFFAAHDARHSIFYLVEFDQVIRDGTLWPRWSPDFAFGYGYPLFNIYAPLAIYAAEIFHLLGTNMVTAVKTIYILTTVGAGLTMFGFVRRLFGSNAGLVAGLAYMFAPFHLVEIYVRSAFAEYVSLMWLPLILWTFTELIAQPTFKRLALAGLSYGLLALTHHATLFTFTPFLGLYILVLIAGKARLNPRVWLQQLAINFGAGVLGVMLASIYLIPLLLEYRFIKVEQWTSGSYNFDQHFVYFSQFLSPFWGYGYAGPGPIDFMPYQIGIVIFGLLAAAIAVLALDTSLMGHRWTAIIFAIATLLTIWLMSPPAAGVWHALPIASLVQFPWRLLIISSLCAAIAIGGGMAALRLENTTALLLGLIVVLASYSYVQPEYTPVPDWTDTPMAVITWDSASIADRVGMVIYTDEQPSTSPLEAQYRAGQSLDAAAVLNGKAKITTTYRGGSRDEIQFSGEEATVQFYRYDYPGWRVKINGETVAHRHERPHGLITVDVPAGEHTIELKMGSTPPRTIGAILSLLAIVVMGASFRFQISGFRLIR